MSIGYKVPAVAHLERGEQKKMWKKKKYESKSVKNENNDVLLQSRTTGSGSACPEYLTIKTAQRLMKCLL